MSNNFFPTALNIICICTKNIHAGQYFNYSEKEYGSRLHGKLSHTALIEKVEELKKTVDGFASKYSKQFFTEFFKGKYLWNFTLRSYLSLDNESITFCHVLILHILYSKTSR